MDERGRPKRGRVDHVNDRMTYGPIVVRYGWGGGMNLDHHQAFPSEAALLLSERARIDARLAELKEKA